MTPICRALLLSAPLSIVLIVDAPIAMVGIVLTWFVVCLGIAQFVGMNEP